MSTSKSQPPELPDSVSTKGKSCLAPGCLLGLGIVVSSMALIPIAIYTLAYVQGKRAEHKWAVFKAHWEAQGEIFDLNKLTPPEISDKENFATAPIISELFDETKPPRLSMLNFDEIPKLKKPTTSVQSPTISNDSRRALGAPKPLVNYLKNPSQAANEKEAAVIILKALKPLEPILSELNEASIRSKANFPIDYTQPFAANFEYVRLLLDSIKTISLRSRARMVLGDSTGARADLTTIFNLEFLIGSQPSLISHLVEATTSKIVLSIIWQGLQSSAYTTADLHQIHESLQKQKLKPRLVRSLRFERASILAVIDSLDKKASVTNPVDEKLIPINRVVVAMKSLGLSSSFILKNKLSYSKFIQEHGLSDGNIINWEGLNVASSLNAKNDLKKITAHPVLGKNPYSIIVGLMGPAYVKIVQSSTQTATRIDLARVAIALELYQREHGNYPATLAPLAPQYIAELPLDLVTGKPLHYRIKADGTPLIYSVGLNKIDEKGLLKKDHTLGDWAWQYTLPDDFDEKDWRN